jgi:putative peptidoglycan lipid II flippase
LSQGPEDPSGQPSDLSSELPGERAGAESIMADSVRHDFAPAELEGSATPANTKAVLGRAAVVILLATVLGRALGLVRDQVVAYFFGAGDATDAFFLAYKIPYLLSLTVGGALTATFIPVFTQRLATGRKKQAWDLSVSMTNAIAVVMLVITGALMLTAPWVIPLFGFGFQTQTAGMAVLMFQILMPSVVFTGIAGLATGILNSLKSFALPAFSVSIGAAATIAFVLVFHKAWGINSLAWGTTVGALVSLAVLFPQMRRRGMRYRPHIDWNMPGMREVGMLVWPILIGSAVGKVSIFVDQTLASTLGKGAVSALSYSEKLWQLPLGLFVAGITIPIFPLLSEHVAAKQPEKLKATLNFGMRLIAFVMLPASVGMIVLRTPLIALLFQHGAFTAEDTANTGWALLFYSIGLYSYAGRDTLTRVFYAYHDTRTPVKISVIAVVVNIAVSATLMLFIGVGGLALGTTVALTLNMIVLMQLLRKKLGPMGFGRMYRSFAGILAASVVMGLLIWGGDLLLAHAVHPGTVGLAIRVAVGTIGGAVVFIAVAALLRLAELREVADMMRAALRRGPKGQDTVVSKRK